MNFTKTVTQQVHNRFSPKEAIEEVIELVREQKIPGKVEIILPGNGGITSIEFIEKQVVVEVETPEIVEPEK